MSQQLEWINKHWWSLTIDIVAIYCCLYLIRNSAEDAVPSTQENATPENQDFCSVTNVTSNGVTTTYEAPHPYANTTDAAEYRALHVYESVGEGGTELCDRHYIEIIAWSLDECTLLPKI